MNLQEALDSAREGNFVTNQMFDKNQSMHYYKGKFYYEDGAVVPTEFLRYEGWANEYPWEVVATKEKVNFCLLDKMHERSMGYMLQKGSYMECIIKDLVYFPMPDYLKD